MPDLRTTYTTFDVYDYKNENVLSSYSLEATPLKFVPDLSLFPNKDVVWSFGDDTTSKSLTATKYYNFPGVYTVNLLVFDCQNNALVSSYSQNVEVKDYIPYTLQFTNLSSNKGYLELPQSVINGPWNLVATYPWYQPVTNIVYDVNGSGSSNFFAVQSDKFVHLRRTYSIFDTLTNAAIQNVQYFEAPEIKISDATRLFAKIDGNSIVNCAESDDGAFFVGLSASKPVYYKDDTVGNTSILFKFSTDATVISEKTVDYMNNLGVLLSADIIPNNLAQKLSITSNGIDGEKTLINSFDIYHTKYINSKIPFVVKVKDTTNHSLKNFDPIELNDLTITVLSGNYLSNDDGYNILTEGGSSIVITTGVVPSIYYTISSINDTLDSSDHGGSFRGYIQFPTSNLVINAVQLSCFTTLQNDNLSSFSLSATSSYFDVLPRDYYDIYKVNENFNASQTMNDLAFQENIKNNPVLFNDFLGAIFGSDNYDHNSIGVKTYEKIANFIQNNSDIDTKNIAALISDMKLVDNEELVFNRSSTNYPEDIDRIANLASISLERLIGTTNKFNQNFDPKGHVQKDTYGKNIGDQLTTLTYVITAGVPIVALEKFSNSYKLLNTYQPLCAGSGNQYTLSQYSSDWGWPLVLPSQFTPNDFDKYYAFFEYVDDYDNTVLENIIDFTNDKTTINGPTPPNTYLFADDGIFNNMFLDSLYQSLSI
jgi:hypothetical protein